MNNSQFLDGTLKSKEIIFNWGYGGYAGIINYTVIIQDINEINFNSDSNEYLFKVFQKKKWWILN